MRNPESITFTLDSDPLFIHPVVHQSEEFVQDFGVREYWRVSLVLRELLANAIAHGNQYMAERKVHCEVARTGGKTFRVVVEDEGNGFDFTSVSTAIPDDPRSIRKRGYILIRNLCQSVEFNERGNRVTVDIEAMDTK